ncbi:MAG: hypothetical protein OXF77_02590, partial [Thaumarchaeota archaeon]|nr:hypothetical protein [Nitrososphaerota archaeon]
MYWSEFQSMSFLPFKDSKEGFDLITKKLRVSTEEDKTFRKIPITYQNWLDNRDKNRQTDWYKFIAQAYQHPNFLMRV